jgi:DNA-binding transcriptional LysR family regulator
VNLTRLITFVEVVRRGTYAGAADALSFTPSAVSQQMAKLEAEAGAALLTRENGGVRLTDAGRLLHEHALAIASAVRAARAGLDALRLDEAGRLRIGACPVAAAAVLPGALRLLRTRVPGAEPVICETAAEAVERAVGEARLEVGLWVSVATRQAADPRTVQLTLRREPLRVAVPSGHPLARREVIDVHELGPEPRWHVDTPRSRLALVAAGEGYALVPEPAADPLPDGVALRHAAGAPEWELRVARNAAAVPSVASLAAVDALRHSASAPPPLRRAA